MLTPMQLTLTELHTFGFVEHNAGAAHSVLAKEIGPHLTLLIDVSPLSYSKRCQDNLLAYTDFEIEFLQYGRKVRPNLPSRVLINTSSNGDIVVSAQNLIYILALSKNPNFNFTHN